MRNSSRALPVNHTGDFPAALFKKMYLWIGFEWSVTAALLKGSVR
jgi:hypothetical protein